MASAFWSPYKVPVFKGYKPQPFRPTKRPDKVDQSRLGLNQDFLRILTESQNHRCAYCQQLMVDGHPTLHPTKEHTGLASEGGQKELDNLISVCYWCNHIRSNLPFPMVLALCDAGLWPVRFHGQHILIVRKYILAALAELGFDADQEKSIRTGRFYFPDYHLEKTMVELNNEEYNRNRRLSTKEARALTFLNLQEAQNHRCCYCGQTFDRGDFNLYPTVEHVIPTAHADINLGRENQVVACHWCNNVRGDLPLWGVVEVVNAGLWPSHLHGTDVSFARGFLRGIIWNDPRFATHDRPVIEADPQAYLEKCGC